MRKKMWVITAIVLGLAVLGIGVYQSDAVHGDPDWSQEEIQEIVNTQYPGEITEITLEQDVQSAEDGVRFEDDGNASTRSMDGDSGEVVEMQEQELPMSQEEENAGEEPSDTGNTSDDHADEAEDDAENQEEQPEDSDQAERPTIDTEEARQIALNEFEGTVTSLELDEDDGRLLYEIEIERGEHEAEMEIDAFTGEIVRSEEHT